jgi:hypothetical protein
MEDTACDFGTTEVDALTRTFNEHDWNRSDATLSRLLKSQA